MVRYDELLEQSAAGALGDAGRSELDMLRREADRFMLIKAHAAVLLSYAAHGAQHYAALTARSVVDQRAQCGLGRCGYRVSRAVRHHVMPSFLGLVDQGGYSCGQ